VLRIRDFRVEEGEDVDLRKRPTRIEPLCASKEEYQRELARQVEKLDALERLHYAAGSRALLVILQGMDTAGKDSAIRHVMRGIDPSGCTVVGFQEPSKNELKHDFLWRAVKELPARGRIAIFNRSYYEDVIVVRVHPELLAAAAPGAKDEPALWRERFRSIVDFERHLRHNGTHVVKIFLHLSKEEQRKRLLSRIDDPTKNWKFSERDVEERARWKDYRRAYEKCLSATSRRRAPWYVVPADEKADAHLIISEVIEDALSEAKPEPPKVDAARRRELKTLRRRLAAEGRGA
jgi:PPK2 family polyphosphate:nucleotide phosphotransferase